MSVTIGDRIKKRREELNMSQEELAHRIGYKSKTSINKIELGVQNLRQSKIREIANALQTTPSNIMGWDEDTQPQIAEVQQVIPSDVIKKCYGSDAFELVELFTQLNDTGKAKALEELSDMVQLPKYTVKKKGLLNA